MSKFADVLKATRDLLEKPFKYENKLEIKTTSKNGVSFGVESVVSKPSSTLIKVDGAQGNLKLDKLQVGSDKKAVLEVSLVEAFPGAKLSFKAADGSRAVKHHAEKPAAELSKASAAPTAPQHKKADSGIKAVIGAEVKQSFGMFTADFDAIDLAVTLTGAVNYSGAILGASAKVAGLAESPALSAYDLILGYKSADFTIAAQTDSKLANVSLGYFHDVSPEIKFATLAHFPTPGTAAPPADSGKSEAGYSVDAALAYKLDTNTTVTGKVNHKGVVGLSYVQQISPLTKLGFASEIHGAEIAGDKHTFGISLNITA